MLAIGLGVAAAYCMEWAVPSYGYAAKGTTDAAARFAHFSRYVDMCLEDDEYTWQRTHKPVVDSAGNDVPELHKQLYARWEAGVIKVLPDEYAYDEATVPTL